MHGTNENGGWRINVLTGPPAVTPAIANKARERIFI
jgi:hypothetical protein